MPYELTPTRSPQVGVLFYRYKSYNRKRVGGIMNKTLLLKVSTILAALPALVFALYLIPLWIGIALEETGAMKTYLMVIFISMVLIVTPYFYSLFLTFKLLIHIEKGTYYTPISRKYLSHIGISAYMVGTILFLDLPFVYGFANQEDAPGIILVFGFFILLAFSIGIFAQLLKDLNEDE